MAACCAPACRRCRSPASRRNPKRSCAALPARPRRRRPCSCASRCSILEHAAVKILALDTATEACSVALLVGDRAIERYVELERGHAEEILPMIHSVLAEGGLVLGALDAIAFGRGPGGFTGVRLAASLAQGLAVGAGLGVVPVSDLAAVALRASVLHPAGHVLVVNDARMREVYWASFQCEDTFEPVDGEHVTVPDLVRLPDGAGWVAAGRGLRAW